MDDLTPEEEAEALRFRLALYRQCKQDAAWLRERFEEYRVEQVRTFFGGTGRLRDRRRQRLPL